MPQNSKDKGINRILDANINRLKEGLRVCEEVLRFILNNRRLSAQIKLMRHRIDRTCAKDGLRLKLIRQRDSLGDVGRDIYINELKRRDYRDIFFANLQRAKESIRVLEEFSKLSSKKSAIEFKDIRYGLYELEKKAAKAISSVRHHR